MDIQTQLERLGDMSDEELTAFDADLNAQLDALSDDLSDENLAQMDVVANGIMSIRETLSAREEDRSGRQNRAAEIRARVGTPSAVEGDPAEAVDDTAAETESAGEPVGAGVAAAANTPKVESVNEPAPTASEMNSRKPSGTDPVRNPALAVTAGAEVPGFVAGSRIDEWSDVGKAFANKVEALVGGRNLASRYGVAKFNLEYPDDRYLSTMDPNGNSSKVRNVISPEAITAAGGLCAPVEAYYDLAQISKASRPVRDSLPKFGAERGGIRFITPPHLSDVTGAVGYVTESDDETGYPPANKPLLTITCGTPTEVDINAVTMRLQVGNFSRRMFPEQFETWYANALAAHAREAETRLLNGISTASTAVTDNFNLSARRDLYEVFGRLAAEYRNRHRMDINDTLQVLLPAWVPAMLRADTRRQAPGDGDGHWQLTVAEVESDFRNDNLDITWYLDGRTGADQIYGTQAAGVSQAWKAVTEGYLFHPGAFLFLDGGTLDLGVDIRDSTLNSTNDVQAFMETFENVAFTGIESLRVRLNNCVSGSGSAAISYSCAGTLS